jgi:hypothetical protein
MKKYLLLLVINIIRSCCSDTSVPVTEKPSTIITTDGEVDDMDDKNEFAARADLCVKEYSEVNHAPVVTLKNPADIEVKPGEIIRLKGTAIDHDGDNLAYSWWQYKEAGNTIHLILEVTDDGIPNLTRYQRVIITVR